MKTIEELFSEAYEKGREVQGKEHNGEKVDDGLIYHLNERLLVYYPEPNNAITIKGFAEDINKIDEFIRKNIS